jgi:NAD(P)-dependent dehydrogenase (short-subunit alcohol dehydrogenase family)
MVVTHLACLHVNDQRVENTRMHGQSFGKSAAALDGQGAGIVDLLQRAQVGTEIVALHAGRGAFLLLGDVGVPEQVTEPDDRANAMAVNAGGVFYMGRAAARHMRAHGGGAVVNISSAAARYAQKRFSGSLRKK